MKKRIVGIIGVGHVGAHCAYAIAIQGIADEIVLVDANAQKAISESQDLMDSCMYFPHRVDVHPGDFADLKDCDVIVNSTGNIDILRNNHDRLDEMDFTIKAVSGYVDKIMASGFDGVIINITNPCDIVTSQIAKLSGLPRGRVFGTGTGLDTSRLRTCLARETGVDHKSINCYMMGEHGASQMAPWSAVSFGGRSLEDCAKLTHVSSLTARPCAQRQLPADGSLLAASFAPNTALPVPGPAWRILCCTMKNRLCRFQQSCVENMEKKTFL
ncbi:MAG: lactate/malate family dehydrogenase [Pygmaiobacter massiliensis]